MYWQFVWQAQVGNKMQDLETSYKLKGSFIVELLQNKRKAGQEKNHLQLGIFQEKT